MGELLNIQEMPRRNAKGDLGSRDVHVWTLPLEASATRLAGLREWLSSDERERAERFRFDIHRNRFIAARGLMREVLGGYLNREPASLDFVYGQHGKPGLRRTPVFEFNLAHSDDVALLAVTRLGNVGVDIERVRVLPDFEELVKRFFSAREAALFSALPGTAGPAAFFNLWTRKEALLKATGEGIGTSLNQVEVTFLPEEPARFLRLPQRLEGQRWTLRSLECPASFSAALAINEADFSISNFELPGL